MRGEKSFKRGQQVDILGSPPLAWGKADCLRKRQNRNGITPTCVGKRHDRGVLVLVVQGSPPLAWGKGLPHPQTRSCRRITPTCVGKRPKWWKIWRGFEDHPHLRGEKSTTTLCSFQLTGSPPLAWGKAPSIFAPQKSLGITPTCVGKSHFVCHPRKPVGDHPHLRGEKRRLRCKTSGLIGSPPLAWGKDRMAIERRPEAWDHPHLRGEKAIRWGWIRPRWGSPPLAWGKASGVVVIKHWKRITPTCVGKSSSGIIRSAETQDHPHLRGEKPPIYSFGPAYQGSPPLAWGKVNAAEVVVQRVGITPTCVGKSGCGR